MALALAMALTACFQAGTSGEGQARSGPVGLFTSLPIFWAESTDLRGLLRDDSPPHWVLTALRRQGEVRPVDSLIAQGTAPALAAIGTLVMAQPRALVPEENVALDAWVRGGGRLLLFADPMLTEESAYPLGDKRRPQDIVLLSPILAHWQLRLEFDEDQPAGERQAGIAGISLPVNLPGRLQVAPGSRQCALLGDGIVAHCRIGKGQALIVADAALLEHHRDPQASGAGETLDWLLARLAAAR